MRTSASATLLKMPPVARPATVCSANWLLTSEPTTRKTQAPARSPSTTGEAGRISDERSSGRAMRATTLIFGGPPSVAEVALPDGLVLPQLLARAGERDTADLEDVRVGRGLE